MHIRIQQRNGKKSLTTVQVKSQGWCHVQGEAGNGAQTRCRTASSDWSLAVPQSGLGWLHALKVCRVWRQAVQQAGRVVLQPFNRAEALTAQAPCRAWRRALTTKRC